MRYPAADTLMTPPPPRFDVEFQPSFNKTRWENIEEFGLFIERNLGVDVKNQIASDFETKPDYVHWATIAAQYVHIHWVR